MKIALCTIGSRGDIQPFLILGEYLSRQGYDVKVSSAKMYAPLATNYDIDYVPFKGDYESILDNNKLKKKIGRNPFLLGKALKEQVYPIIESSLETFYDLTQWADIVLYHPKTMIDRVSYDMQHKLIKAYVVPLFTPTKAFSNPILTFLPIPGFLNKSSYKLSDVLMNSLSQPIKKFRNKKKLRKSNINHHTTAVYGISPSFLQRPADYPSNHYYTGFWIKENNKQELTEELQTFMSTPKEVVIITFGSMPYHSKIHISDFIDALIQEYNVSVLLVKGWGLQDVEIRKSKDVLAVDFAPFEQLFPLANYVIHHGGAGTTALALKAGIPQMICPVLHPVGDQYFWGKQVEKIKVGVKPIPLKKLTIQTLMANFSALRNKDLKTNANKLKQQIEREKGLSAVEEIIKEHYLQHAK